MHSLLDDLLWMRILDHYLSDPADWGRFSATCRRFRRLGRPLCLQLTVVEECGKDDANDSSFQKESHVLPQLLFLEPIDDRRPHSVMVRVNDMMDALVKPHTDIKYRIWMYHKQSSSRAYLCRNHRYPNRTGNAYIHGLAFHVGVYERHQEEDEKEEYCRKDQCWTFVQEEENSNDGANSFCFSRLKISGNCTTLSAMDSIYNTKPKSLSFDKGNYWFVHSGQSSSTDTNTTLRVSCKLKPYKFSRGGNAEGTIKTTTSIMVQPRPFLSQDGGWNLYEPGVWQHVLNVTTTQQGMIQPRNNGRCTCLQFHCWIQDSYFYCHVQYLVFPIRLPILVTDNIKKRSRQRSMKTNDCEKKSSYSFLCDYLWEIFSICHQGSGTSGRWEALRHYFCMAANELSRYQYLSRRHAAVTGRDDYRLPPPARTDEVPDAADDGSLGLTATHAANTWQAPPSFNEGEYRYEYAYQACRVEDPTQPQQPLNWNNVLHLQCHRRHLTSRQGEQERLSVLNDEQLDPHASNHPKDTSQRAWSIVFYA